MNDVSEEELGPIDYMVVEFPAGTSNFSGAMAAELAALAEAELIRVLDLMILTKDQDGNIEVLEVEDLDGTGELGSIEADLAEILEDLADKPGFEPEVTRTIEAYRGSGIKYTFPTVSLLKEALAETFEVTATFTKSYELGERCPTLVLRRR